MSSEKSERDARAVRAAYKERCGEWTDRCFLKNINLLTSRREEILSGSSSSHSGDAGSAGLIDWMRAARYSKHPRSKAARQRAVSSLTR
jgi:hypothetical protein